MSPASESVVAGHTARAVFRPQGTCPKSWIAQVNGETLFDARGGQRRFSTEEAAQRAAIAKAVQP